MTAPPQTDRTLPGRGAEAPAPADPQRSPEAATADGRAAGMPQPLANVAVVAVHGVADQAPGTSARAVADLLLSLLGRREAHGGTDDRALYTSFREHPFRLPLHALPVRAEPGEVADRAGGAATSSSGWEERASTLRRVVDAEPSAAAGAPRDVSARTGVHAALDYQVMREQLVFYDRGGEPPVYDTVRLEGQALGTAADGGAPEANVHVYEMYWADLSRLGAGAFRVFGELYQLLLSLPHLGRQALDFASAKHSHGESAAAWRRYGGAHRWAVRALTLPVALLNVMLLAVGLGFVPLALPPGARPWIASAVAGLAATALVGRLVWKARSSGGFLVWCALPLLCGAAAAAGISTAVPDTVPAWSRVLTVEWMALAGLAVWAVLGVYDRRRPGARKVGMWLYWLSAALLTGWLLYYWFSPPTGWLLYYGPSSLGGAADATGSAAARSVAATAPVLLAIVRAFEGLWVLLAVAWFVVVGAALSTVPLRRRVWTHAKRGRTSDDGDREWTQVRRATRIASATLAIPATLLLVISLSLWSALFAVTERADIVPACGYPTRPLPWLTSYLDETRFPGYPGGLDDGASTPPAPCAAWDGERVEARAYLRAMLALSGTSGFIPMLALAGAALVVALWTLGPVVWTEVRPPRIDRSPHIDPGTGRESTAAARAESERAWRLGAWLSRGFGAMPLAGVLIFTGVFCALPLGTALGFAARLDATGSARAVANALGARLDWTAALLLHAGLFIAASTVGVLALRGRLDVLALGFRPVIDVALDVESYLRLHPSNHTPRARIAERYVSLLRYLCGWRTNDAGPRRPYDAIVLVAHSQGTVITADLLGFLTRELQRPTDESAIAADDPLRFLGTADPTCPGCAEVPVYLFTMGSPLRQLYGAAFPHQYEWVEGRTRPEEDLQAASTAAHRDLRLPGLPQSNADGPPHVNVERVAAALGHKPQHVAAERILDDAAPDPWAIRVRRWVNVYRSGDYVGRSLWRKTMPPASAASDYLHRRSCIGTDGLVRWVDNSPYYLVASEDDRHSRRELCIGAGAHTHYWDATAHDVAIELDLLVRDAVRTWPPRCPTPGRSGLTTRAGWTGTMTASAGAP